VGVEKPQVGNVRRTAHTRFASRWSQTTRVATAAKYEAQRGEQPEPARMNEPSEPALRENFIDRRILFANRAGKIERSSAWAEGGHVQAARGWWRRRDRKPPHPEALSATPISTGTAFQHVNSQRSVQHGGRREVGGSSGG